MHYSFFCPTIAFKFFNSFVIFPELAEERALSPLPRTSIAISLMQKKSVLIPTPSVENSVNPERFASQVTAQQPVGFKLLTTNPESQVESLLCSSNECDSMTTTLTTTTIRGRWFPTTITGRKGGDCRSLWGICMNPWVENLCKFMSSFSEFFSRVWWSSWAGTRGQGGRLSLIRSKAMSGVRAVEGSLMYFFSFTFKRYRLLATY